MRSRLLDEQMGENRQDDERGGARVLQMPELRHETGKGAPPEQMQEQQQASSVQAANPSPRKVDELDLHSPATGEMAVHVPVGTEEMFQVPPEPAKSNVRHCGRTGRHKMDQLCGGKGEKAN